MRYVTTWAGGRSGDERMFQFDGSTVRVIYGEPQELKAGLATALGRKFKVRKETKEKGDGE